MYTQCMQVYLCKTATECNVVQWTAACTAVNGATVSTSTPANTYFEIAPSTNKLNCPTVRAFIFVYVCACFLIGTVKICFAFLGGHLEEILCFSEISSPFYISEYYEVSYFWEMFVNLVARGCGYIHNVYIHVHACIDTCISTCAHMLLICFVHGE